MAETHFYLGEGGVVWPLDVPLTEPILEKITKGYLRRVNEDGSPWVPPAPVADEPRPAPSAVKPDWVGYAVRVHGLNPDEADGMTKADLIEKFGSD